MLRRFAVRSNVGTLLLMVGVIAAALWLLQAGQGKGPGLIAGSEAALRRPAGYPQLVSRVALPSVDGEMCQWVPASAGSTLVASFRQEQASGQAASASSARTSVDADRAPVRVIRDSYPTYSAVAVDTNSNEVYLQDENLFGYKVFNRMDNTPPTANFTEPKRMVGGIDTKLEFNCGLYVDPESGDVYSVANDTVDTMVIFPRDARGNVAPKRALQTPHGTFGIAVDEVNKNSSSRSNTTMRSWCIAKWPKERKRRSAYCREIAHSWQILTALRSTRSTTGCSSAIMARFTSPAPAAGPRPQLGR